MVPEYTPIVYFLMVPEYTPIVYIVMGFFCFGSQAFPDNIIGERSKPS